MQFIDGQTLAAMIADLRQLAGLQGPEGQVPAKPARQEPRPPEALASELVSGRWAPANRGTGDLQPTGAYTPSAPAPTAPATETATQPAAAISTERSTKNPAFFRTVANLGVQAAEALEH